MNSLAWFNRARYGLFVHWGPYSVAARGEWVRNRERIPKSEYIEKYAAQFHAANFDPKEWARIAKAAGMGYAVLTARHHDGFCLWGSATTEFNAVRLGPKRDLLAPFIHAMRSEGIKVGLYYSVADWSHPDYPDAYARDWPTSWPDASARDRFIGFYRAQLEELMTRFGTIDLLWYDGCFPGPLDGEETNRRIYKLQPDILINERNGTPFDFRCSEQSLKAPSGPWEACITLNDNWGYHAGDSNWKSARQVIHSLITCARSGGNLLLNVGPRGDGTIPAQAVAILEQAGTWLGRNREFLPDSDRCEISWNNWGLITSRANRIYLHIFSPPRGDLCVAELANKVEAARLLENGDPVAFEHQGDRLILRGLPAVMSDQIATTVALDLDGPPRPLKKQETFWIPG